MRHTTGLISTAILLFLTSSSPAVQITFFHENGINPSPRGLYDYDSATNTRTFRVAVGGIPENSLPRLFDFAVRPSDGAVFGAEPQSTHAPNNYVYRLDPFSGALQKVGGPTGLLYQSLAFHPTTNLLYATTYRSSSDPEQLVVVNQTTGAVDSIIGNLAQKRLGIAFDPAGRLLGIVANNSGGSNRGELYSLNLATAATTRVGTNTTTVANSIVDLQFIGASLYALDFNGQLYQINTVSGGGTQIGMPGFTGTGGFFDPSLVHATPEPGSLALLGFGSLAVVAISRRRRRR